MDFTLEREDRFPEDTSVSAYPRAAWHPGRAPVGSATATATVTDGRLLFEDLDEGALYVAYALVGGEHRYINFSAPYLSDAPAEAGQHAAWDAASGKHYYTEGGFVAFDPVLDGDLVEGDDVSESVAMENSVALQNAADRVAARATGDKRLTYIELPPGDFRTDGVVREPPNTRFKGSGCRGGTRIAPHNAWEANGPVFAGQRDDDNNLIPWDGFVLEDIEIDGDYQNTDAFLVRATLTADALFATSGTDGEDNDGSGPDKILASMSVNVHAGSIPSAGGRLLFATYVGDNVGLIRYTGSTGGTPDPDPAKPDNVLGTMTLTGVTYVNQSNSTPIDLLAADSVEFRYYGATTTELVAVDGCHDLWINRCYLHDSGSQQVQLGGHPYSDDGSGVLDKQRVWLTFSEFSRSYNSDSVDIKTSAKVYVIGCESHGSHDTGLDIRGQAVSVIGGDYSWSHTGVSISCTSEVLPAPAAALASPITKAAGQTVTVADRYDDNWPLTFTGTLQGTEDVSGTLVKGSPGTATLSGRALHGTEAVAAVANSSGHISFLRADVEDVFNEYDFPSLVSRSGATVSGVTANHCDGNGVSVSGSGTGLTQVHLTDITANECRNSGVYVRATRGVVEVTINGVFANYCGFNYEFTDIFPFGDTEGDGLANGEPAVWIRNCRSVTVSNIVANYGGGSCMQVDDCGNGIHISNFVGRGSAGYKLDGGSAGNTHVHWDGRGDRDGNALGAWRLPANARKTGSAFGTTTMRFRRGTAIRTANPREANYELPLTSQAVIGARIDVIGSMKVRALSSYTTVPASSSTGSRLAIAQGDPATPGLATILAITGSGAGLSGLFATLGTKINNLINSAEIWPDLGGDYWLLALHNGSATPKVAAWKPTYVGRVATWERMESGILVAQSDLPAVGSSLTLVNSVALAGETFSAASTTVTVTSTTGLIVGHTIEGPGIPLSAYVTAITDATHFVLSASPTATSGLSMTSGATTDTSKIVTVTSTTGLAVGQDISGTGIPAGAKVESITNGTTFVLTVAATATNTGLTLTATSDVTGYWDVIPCLTGAVST